jgi:hypothetical protein
MRRGEKQLRCFISHCHRKNADLEGAKNRSGGGEKASAERRLCFHFEDQSSARPTARNKKPFLAPPV